MLNVFKYIFRRRIKSDDNGKEYVKRKIKELSVKGYSLREIANILKNDGIEISHQTVKRRLTEQIKVGITAKRNTQQNYGFIENLKGFINKYEEYENIIPQLENNIRDLNIEVERIKTDLFIARKERDEAIRIKNEGLAVLTEAQKRYGKLK